LISHCTSKQSKLTLTEYDSIGDISPLWDAFLPENHSLKSGNLEVLELAKLDDMVFKYLLVQNKNILKGVVYLQHLRIRNAHFDGTSIDKPGLGWLKKIVNNQFSDVLICGNLFRIHFPGFYFSEDTDASLVFELLMEYLNSNKGHSKFCGIILKDCLSKLNNTGKFRSYHDDVTMELELRENWYSLEDYKASLDKKYRQRFQKIRNSKAKVDSKELSFEAIKTQADCITRLYQNVALKQALRIGFVNANYFAQMKRRHGDNFVFKAYYLNGEMLAFSSHIFYPDKSMEIHYIGLDYNFNETHCLYFNILYDGVELGIKNRVNRLELGRTARVAKASVGAQPVEVHNYLYLKSGIPCLAFSFFNTWFVKNLGEEWKERNPFKKVALPDDVVQ